jgi:hypothetical protein
MVNTAWERDDTGFMSVAATVRSLSPASISSAISAYDVTDRELRPSTNGPVTGCSRTRRDFLAVGECTTSASSPPPLITPDVESVIDVRGLGVDGCEDEVTSRRSFTFSL